MLQDQLLKPASISDEIKDLRDEQIDKEKEARQNKNEENMNDSQKENEKDSNSIINNKSEFTSDNEQNIEHKLKSRYSEVINR